MVDLDRRGRVLFGHRRKRMTTTDLAMFKTIVVLRRFATIFYSYGNLGAVVTRIVIVQINVALHR